MTTESQVENEFPAHHYLELNNKLDAKKGFSVAKTKLQLVEEFQTLLARLERAERQLLAAKELIGELEEWIKEIGDINGPYKYLDGTSVISASRLALQKIKEWSNQNDNN